ncbi:MAG: response regulator transcription factor [Anaerolineae bacterium]|nr:response regulator transcription factor [Anaerolineae bacterium]
MTTSIDPIRVLIVDDHPVFRHGLRSLLSAQEGFVVAGELESGNEVFPFLSNTVADIVLLDIKMYGQSGIDVARRLRKSHPQIKIIMLTTYDDESYLHQCMQAGVDGYLLKSVSHDVLPKRIRAVMQGETVLSSPMVASVMRGYKKLAVEQARQQAQITPEDLKLLAAMSEGDSIKCMAENFHWSEATVKRKVQEIIEKLGATNRVQAIAKAIRMGWI